MAVRRPDRTLWGDDHLAEADHSLGGRRFVFNVPGSFILHFLGHHCSALRLNTKVNSRNARRRLVNCNLVNVVGHSSHTVLSLRLTLRSSVSLLLTGKNFVDGQSRLTVVVS